VLGALVRATLSAPSVAGAALRGPERTVLAAYLEALAHARYATAFALLSADERRYFETPANLASVFTADRFRILSYRILGSEPSAKGTVAVVSEHVAFVDHASGSSASVFAKVPYAIVAGPHGPAIRDPGHPWKAVAPAGFNVDRAGVSATVRKISFFTGRIEFVLTFQNRSSRTVTFLPYGRSVVRDAKGAAFRPIALRTAGLTDRTLYAGLRLPSSGEYTGFMTFATPDRFEPTALRLSLAPALSDGGDAPFSLDFDTLTLPH